MMIKCPECGHQVSDKAKACPACGFPIEELKGKHMLIDYDPETMEGATPEDQRSIDVATEFYGDLLAGTDGRVWNGGGQLVGFMKWKSDGNNS